jgi:hypothetical protein
MELQRLFAITEEPRTPRPDKKNARAYVEETKL